MVAKGAEGAGRLRARAGGVASPVVLVAGSALLTLPAAATMPPNPERPLEAATCQAALARVREAAVGSPLVSAAENRAILLAAVAQAERLCLPQIDKKPAK